MTRERGCAGTVVHRRAVFSGGRWRGEIIGCVVADGEIVPREVKFFICGGCGVDGIADGCRALANGHMR